LELLGVVNENKEILKTASAKVITTAEAVDAAIIVLG